MSAPVAQLTVSDGAVARLRSTSAPPSQPNRRTAQGGSAVRLSAPGPPSTRSSSEEPVTSSSPVVAEHLVVAEVAVDLVVARAVPWMTSSPSWPLRSSAFGPPVIASSWLDAEDRPRSRVWTLSPSRPRRRAAVVERQRHAGRPGRRSRSCPCRARRGGRRRRPCGLRRRTRCRRRSCRRASLPSRLMPVAAGAAVDARRRRRLRTSLVGAVTAAERVVAAAARQGVITGTAVEACRPGHRPRAGPRQNRLEAAQRRPGRRRRSRVVAGRGSSPTTMSTQAVDHRGGRRIVVGRRRSQWSLRRMTENDVAVGEEVSPTGPCMHCAGSSSTRQPMRVGGRLIVLAGAGREAQRACALDRSPRMPPAPPPGR